MAIIISFSTGLPVDRAAPVPVLPDPPPAQKTAFVPSCRTRGTVSEESRKAMLAKIHVAKKQLGLKDEEYRAMLDDRYGVDSAGKLEGKQLHDFLLALARVGFTATKGSAPGRANRKKAIPATLQPDADDPLGRTPYMKKIEALLTEKGRVEKSHVPWGYAVAILKKQSGGVTKCFEHASVDQLKGVIAALVYDARRKGRYAGTGEREDRTGGTHEHAE